MKNIRTVIFYASVLLIFGLFIYWTIQQGGKLESGREVLIPTSTHGAWFDFVSSLKESLRYPLSTLLIQIVAIILTARIFGWML